MSTHPGPDLWVAGKRGFHRADAPPADHHVMHYVMHYVTHYVMHQAREDFIERTRQQITAMRDEVQGASVMDSDSAGFSTKGKGSVGLPSLGKSKGYAHAGGEESVPLGHGDIEMNGRSVHGGQPA